MGDEQKSQGNPSQPARRPTVEEYREQQAIAAALMIGEESRRDDRKQIYWITLRAGLLVALVSLIGLLILFAYAQIRKGYNPTLWMVIIGAVGAAGMAAVYWAYAESRRE